MRQDLLIILILISALLSIMVVACNRNMEPNAGSVFYQIDRSEKLRIPVAIDLPANLPGGNIRVATYFAEGVQKYRAQPKAGSDPTIYEWVFVAPQADIYDAGNKKIGTHSAGPSWQLFGSADSISAQQHSPPKAVASPDPGSIDWLQLMPKSGKPPTGIFKEVLFIQRIATNGGKAPARLPVDADETIDVRYTAVYRFSTKSP